MKKGKKKICLNLMIFLALIAIGLHLNVKDKIFNKNKISTESTETLNEIEEVISENDSIEPVSNELTEDESNSSELNDKELADATNDDNKDNDDENKKIIEPEVRNENKNNELVPKKEEAPKTQNVKSPTSRTTNSLSNVKNYNIYYGYDMPDSIIESMGKYDLLILDSINLDTKAKFQKVKARGAKIYGYISFAEVQPYDTQRLAKISNSDYLLINGKRVQNWGCDIADIRSENYKRILMQEIQSKIIDAGYDGLFIDTLDDYEYVDYMKSEALVNEMTSETAKLLERVHMEFPNLSVIVNRAFKGISKCKGRYIDGVLFECMNATDDIEGFNYVAKQIDNFTSKGGICLSISTEVSQKDSGLAKAKEKGWVHFYRPDEDYTTWYEYLNK